MVLLISISALRLVEASLSPAAFRFVWGHHSTYFSIEKAYKSGILPEFIPEFLRYFFRFTVTALRNNSRAWVKSFAFRRRAYSGSKSSIEWPCA